MRRDPVLFRTRRTPFAEVVNVSRFRFYHISEKYINFLHSIDHRVQLNKGERRPYIGIVLTINGLDYYVPLESPKPNHAALRSGVIFKLDEGRLGIMGFNNMIPVRDVCLVEFDIQQEPDPRYRALLYKQLAFCDKSYDIICSRARSVYNKRVAGNVAHYDQVCCDFRNLEFACRRYDPNHRKIKKKPASL